MNDIQCVLCGKMLPPFATHQTTHINVGGKSMHPTHCMGHMHNGVYCYTIMCNHAMYDCALWIANGTIPICAKCGVFTPLYDMVYLNASSNTLVCVGCK